MCSRRASRDHLSDPATGQVAGSSDFSWLAFIGRTAKADLTNGSLSCVLELESSAKLAAMSSAEELAILRIELAEIEPLIWRRVAVRTSTNLETLHKIIQAAMGWLDYHLWEFTVDDVIYGVPDPDDASWGHKVQRASTTKLAKLLDSGVKAFEYVYDMGDNWEHRVIVERIEPTEPERIPVLRTTLPT